MRRSCSLTLLLTLTAALPGAARAAAYLADTYHQACIYKCCDAHENCSGDTPSSMPTRTLPNGQRIGPAAVQPLYMGGDNRTGFSGTCDFEGICARSGEPGWNGNGLPPNVEANSSFSVESGCWQKWIDKSNWSNTIKPCSAAANTSVTSVNVAASGAAVASRAPANPAAAARTALLARIAGQLAKLDAKVAASKAPETTKARLREKIGVFQSSLKASTATADALEGRLDALKDAVESALETVKR